MEALFNMFLVNVLINWIIFLFTAEFIIGDESSPTIHEKLLHALLWLLVGTPFLIIYLIVKMIKK